MTLNWPEGIYPKSQKFYLSHPTSRHISSYTGQFQVKGRDAARWFAEFEFELDSPRSRIMDGFIAAMRGAVTPVLVPDFRRNVPVPVTQSMDDYADEIGLTFFDDRYDFDDQTHEDGFLTHEEGQLLGTEDVALFGGVFDALMVFVDEVSLLTEAGDDVLAENIGLPFETDRGFLLSIEGGEALPFQVEEGFLMITEDREILPLQIGGGFFEGVGQPILVQGGDHRLFVRGMRPYTGISVAGDSIMPATGHGHLIISDVITDINGMAFISIEPRLRTTVSEQPLILDGILVSMRLTDDEGAANPTVPPNRSSYSLTFEQILT